MHQAATEPGVYLSCTLSDGRALSTAPVDTEWNTKPEQTEERRILTSIGVLRLQHSLDLRVRQDVNFARKGVRKMASGD